MSFEVEDGGFGYGDKYLFRNVNFNVGDNEVLAILGPNGSGKTTMLKCMMNILRWKEGTVKLGGKNVSGMSLRAFSQKVAYVPQAKTYSFDRSAIDMVMLGRSPHISIFEEPSGKDAEMAEDKLRCLGISHLAERSCSTLSGGELQMVLIARALVTEPEVLIMDEPESNLDYHNQLRILNIIKGLSESMSCIMNTHYPEHALRIADKALLISKGGRTVHGRTDDVITAESIGDTFNVNTAMGDIKVGSDTLRYVLPVSIRR
ncbi:MAG: ABC transporter ATP-binding protein [Candidatus Methanoplasma sp.]|jgi:iron complex transport system ATP-binding protein|nr:ABC transporter ATP-binding protein [Candidatus Methanoplasma sp.]